MGFIWHPKEPAQPVRPVAEGLPQAVEGYQWRPCRLLGTAPRCPGSSSAMAVWWAHGCNTTACPSRGSWWSWPDWVCAWEEVWWKRQSKRKDGEVTGIKGTAWGCCFTWEGCSQHLANELLHQMGLHSLARILLCPKRTFCAFLGPYPSMTPKQPSLPQKSSNHKRKDDGNGWSWQQHWKKIAYQQRKKSSLSGWRHPRGPGLSLDCQPIWKEWEFGISLVSSGPHLNLWSSDENT